MQLTKILGATIAILLAVCVGIAGLAIFYANQLGQKTLDMYDRPLMSINLAQSARVNSQIANSAMISLLAQGYSEDAHDMFLIGVEDMLIDLEVLLERNSLPSAKTVIDEIYVEGESILVDGEVALDDGVAPEADFGERLANLDNSLLELVEMQAEHGYFARELAVQEKDGAVELIIGASGAAVVLCLAISGLAFRRFSKGLRGLRASVRQMASGALETSVFGHDRSDEVGEIASELEGFRQGAQSFRAELEHVLGAASEGDYSQRVKTEGLGTTEMGYVVPLNQFLGEIEEAVAAMHVVLTDFSTGRFSRRMEGTFQGVLADMQAAANSTGAQLEAMFEDIRTVALQLAETSSDISQGSDTLSGQATSQAASIEEVTATLEALTQTVSETSDTLKGGEALAQQAVSTTSTGRQQSESARSVISSVSDNAKKIKDISTLVDDIAFQTNLLALNAGVEAARAGRHGLGFAVVANEVRQLAHRTAEASKSISELTTQTSETIAQGVVEVSEVASALDQIAEKIEEMHTVMSGIAKTGEEQAQAVSEITNAMRDLEQKTQSSASAATESASHAHVLSKQSDRMHETLGRWNSDGQDTQSPTSALLTFESTQGHLNNSDASAA